MDNEWWFNIIDQRKCISKWTIQLWENDSAAEYEHTHLRLSILISPGCSASDWSWSATTMEWTELRQQCMHPSHTLDPDINIFRSEIQRGWKIIFSGWKRYDIPQMHWISSFQCKVSRKMNDFFSLHLSLISDHVFANVLHSEYGTPGTPGHTSIPDSQQYKWLQFVQFICLYLNPPGNSSLLSTPPHPTQAEKMIFLF